MAKIKTNKEMMTHVPYDAEERYAFFVERKIVCPRPHKSKKDYSRKGKNAFRYQG